MLSIKHHLIIGGSSGIGLGVVNELLNRGQKVSFLGSRDFTQIQGNENLKNRVTYYKKDLSKIFHPGECCLFLNSQQKNAEISKRIEKEIGSIFNTDTIFLNAGKFSATNIDLINNEAISLLFGAWLNFGRNKSITTVINSSAATTKDASKVENLNTSFKLYTKSKKSLEENCRKIYNKHCIKNQKLNNKHYIIRPSMIRTELTGQAAKSLGMSQEEFITSISEKRGIKSMSIKEISITISNILMNKKFILPGTEKLEIDTSL